MSLVNSVYLAREWNKRHYYYYYYYISQVKDARGGLPPTKIQDRERERQTETKTETEKEREYCFLSGSSTSLDSYK